jgi:hypothetical protein
MLSASRLLSWFSLRRADDGLAMLSVVDAISFYP